MKVTVQSKTLMKYNMIRVPGIPKACLAVAENLSENIAHCAHARHIIDAVNISL